jgi:hypothetical protein
MQPQVWRKQHRSRYEIPIFTPGILRWQNVVDRAENPGQASGTGQCSCLSPRFSGRSATDPLTGQRRRLPPQLHLPTKKELNDKLAASILDPGDRPARLNWALRSRARRAAIRK